MAPWGAGGSQAAAGRRAQNIALRATAVPPCVCSSVARLPRRRLVCPTPGLSTSPDTAPTHQSREHARAGILTGARCNPAHQGNLCDARAQQRTDDPAEQQATPRRHTRRRDGAPIAGACGCREGRRRARARALRARAADRHQLAGRGARLQTRQQGKRRASYSCTPPPPLTCSPAPVPLSCPPTKRHPPIIILLLAGGGRRGGVGGRRRRRRRRRV